MESLLQELETQKPLEPWLWSNGLARACQKFGMWAGPNGILGHSGPNGKNMGDRINAEGKFTGHAGETIGYGSINGKDA